MDSMIAKQVDVCNRISNAYQNFKKSPKDRITKLYIEVRLETLEKFWQELESNHLMLTGEHYAELKSSSYIQKGVYDTAQELYYTYKEVLLSGLEKYKTVNTNEKEENASCGSSPATSKVSVKLPKIVIPTFSGKYTEWVTFRDLFESLVHNNTSLDNVQKLHYLKGYLTGEAEQLLRQIPISQSNYVKCWELLQERYNNKKIICHTILKRFLSQKNATFESATYLKELLDTSNDCLSALTNIGIDTSTWDVIVIHLLTLKLDPESRKQWELSSATNTNSDKLPTFMQFKEFLTNRYRALELLECKKPVYHANSVANNQKPRALHVNVNNQCPMCLESHKIVYCKKFSSQDVDSRRAFAQEKGLCFNCLGINHVAKTCPSLSTCRSCKRRHHSLLHPGSFDAGTSFDKATNHAGMVQEEEVGTSNVGTSGNFESKGAAKNCSLGNKKQVLLTTALIGAQAKNGEYYTIRALLDQGSQASFVTEATTQYLGLKKTPIQGSISGLGENNVLSKSMVTLNLQSLILPEVKLSVKAYVLKSVTTVLPAKKVAKIDEVDLLKIQLADPNYHTPSKIDVLLGAEVFSQVIRDGVIRNIQGSLLAQLTSFGWVLSGAVQSADDLSDNVVVLHSYINEDEALKKFWELETSIGNVSKMLSEEERRCEELFEKTTTRDNDGRYIVKLPFRDEDPGSKHGSSLEVSEKRFYSLENRLNKNVELKSAYTQVIEEYLHLGHMEQVPENEKESSDAVYLPHHAVVKLDRETTKVRVVFDASCKGKNGVSLNDDLLIGPRLQPDLRHLVLRWRIHPICLTADVEKMYRQVKVSKEDADFQRILWRVNDEAELTHYRLLTVTFGTACAPYLAVKSMQQVAFDDGEAYPSAVNPVLQEFYMDDLMTGCQTIEEGVKIYKEVKELLGKAGFKLQKWTSNSNELLRELKLEEMDRDIGIKIKQDQIIKILGLTWNRERDVFQYSVKLLPMKEPVTKRIMISDISRLFDPVGWLAPCVIVAKGMIQKLWLTGLDWDESVSSNLLNEWCTYRDELKLLEAVCVPRWLGTKNTDQEVELHGFCDASKIAYAAVVYIRVVDPNGVVTVSLVTAKTKVSPIKQVSIPRLELCGAVLVSKLLAESAELLKIDKNKIHAWTDSTIVLAWLSSHPNRWKTFVANRVSEILTTLEANQWAHVSSKHNPADCASRGVSPSELLTTKLWFNGPDFLKQEKILYSKPKDSGTNLEEVKVLHVATDIDIWERFSSLTRLIRVVAFCRRFLNLKKPGNERQISNYLTSQELREATNTCVKQCQEQHFKEEIKCLAQNKPQLQKGSCLKGLNPFFDENGILRVGGRLEKAHLSYNRKHPILLPKKSSLTQLIVADAHLKTLHGGAQLMHNYISSRYFILRVLEVIKAHVRKCIPCVRQNVNTTHQLMGQLPAARLTPMKPFKSCGVDYAGPIQLRTASGRGHKSYKGYICLFICMATRAVHIEAVSDLTAKGFLQAFKRMVARRGPCQEMWSDNGTNFVGASAELRKMFQDEKSTILKEIAENLAVNGTAWRFIPPHSPNFGGLWEAGIKSVKYHLKRVIGESTLTFEEMTTVLAQIEACLNSRPISRMDSDPNNLDVLTPGHFLTGEPLVTVPDQDFLNTNIGNLRRWQYTQRMIQDFWRKWSQEYLLRFLHRYRWSNQTPEPAIDSVVLVKEDNLPPSRWLLGRVVQKHPGHDGITRVVTLRIKNSSQIKRPTSKLCILPVSDRH